MSRKATIFKFFLVFLLSFIFIEVVELSISYLFHVDLHDLKWGWLGFVVLYGFKYHILCCLIPAIWASYKCKHKKCEHDYCDDHSNQHTTNS